MRKILGLRALLALLSGLALAAPLAFLGAQSASAATLGPVIFFSPHQDDETLSFGADAENHIAAGREVLIVLLTDGSSTGVCQDDYGDGGYTDAERAACTARRDQEFINAVHHLHATPIIPAVRARDNSMTEAFALSVMQQYQAMYPNASFKTMTYHESEHCTRCNNGTTGAGEPDHANAGRALEDLQGTTDKRYYIMPELWTTFKDLGKFQQQRKIGDALLDYTDIGWRSVPHDFHEQASAGYCDCTTKTGYVTDGGADSKYHLPGQ